MSHSFRDHTALKIFAGGGLAIMRAEISTHPESDPQFSLCPEKRLDRRRTDPVRLPAECVTVPPGLLLH